jgi:hypothetical protein
MLNSNMCTCGRPSSVHLPCSHMVTTCRVRRVDVEAPSRVGVEFSLQHTKVYHRQGLESRHIFCVCGRGVLPPEHPLGAATRTRRSPRMLTRLACPRWTIHRRPCSPFKLVAAAAPRELGTLTPGTNALGKSKVKMR